MNGDPLFFLNDPDIKKFKRVVNLGTLTMADVIRLNTFNKNADDAFFI
jgi:hypothetical protein